MDEKTSLTDLLEQELDDKTEEELNISSTTEYVYSIIKEGEMASKEKINTIIIKNCNKNNIHLFTLLSNFKEDNLIEEVNIRKFENEEEILIAFENFIEYKNINDNTNVVWDWDKKENNKYLRTRYIINFDNYKRDYNVYKNEKEDYKCMPFESIYQKSLKRNVDINKNIPYLNKSTLKKKELENYLEDNKKYLKENKNKIIYNKSTLKSYLDGSKYKKDELYNLIVELDLHRGDIIYDYACNSKDLTKDSVKSKAKSLYDVYTIFSDGNDKYINNYITYDRKYYDILENIKNDVNELLLNHIISSVEMKDNIREIVTDISW